MALNLSGGDRSIVNRLPRSTVRVTVVYLGPVSDITKREKETIALKGSTLGHLLQALAERHGEKLREALIDPHTGDIVPGMAAIVNGQRLAADASLKDGDEVALVMAIAGG